MILSWQIKAVIALVAVLSAGYAGHVVTHNHWSSKWAERDAADAKALIAANESEREKELSWQAKIEKVAEDAKAKQAQYIAENNDLVLAVDRMRGTLNVSTSKLQSASATVTELRRAAATSELVQSELSGWCVSRIEVMAGIIDRSQSAGLACQKSYSAIRFGDK
jgi:hypothetical protein